MTDAIIAIIDNRGGGGRRRRQIEFDHLVRTGGVRGGRPSFGRDINRLAERRGEGIILGAWFEWPGASLKSRKKMLNRSLNRYKRALRDPITVLDSEP